MKQLGPSLAGVFMLSLHKIVIIFIDGLITACFLLRWVSVANRTELWVGESPKVYSFLNYLMAVYFVCSGFSKIIGFSAILVFFHLSGYPVSFLYFIIVFEIIAGIALLFKQTTAIAALVLMVEMAGATITHYHNYFEHQVPGPFSNSLDSLKMLPFLLVIALLHHPKRSKFLA